MLTFSSLPEFADFEDVDLSVLDDARFWALRARGEQPLTFDSFLEILGLEWGHLGDAAYCRLQAVYEDLVPAATLALASVPHPAGCADLIPPF